jgi:hypothetical protein
LKDAAGHQATFLSPPDRPRTKALGAVTTAYNAARWTDFGGTVVQAGATLSGLVFVVVSINLGRILGHPSLPARAWQTLGLLLTPMLTGIFLLIPGQSSKVLAWELIVSALLLAGSRVAIDLRASRFEKTTPLPLVGRLAGSVNTLAPGLVSYVCLAVAGATLLARSGGGLFWLAPSVLVAFIFGLISAWTLLVEIPPEGNR